MSIGSNTWCPSVLLQSRGQPHIGHSLYYGHNWCPLLQELEELSSKLAAEKQAIEEAAKNLRQEKDTADQ